MLGNVWLRASDAFADDEIGLVGLLNSNELLLSSFSEALVPGRLELVVLLLLLFVNEFMLDAREDIDDELDDDKRFVCASRFASIDSVGVIGSLNVFCTAASMFQPNASRICLHSSVESIWVISFRMKEMVKNYFS